MALKWAGSRVSMSVSHATTRVRLSCASDRSGANAAPPSAAAPAVTFRNDRRSIRLLMLGLLLASGLLIDRLRPEEDVLWPLQVVAVELADQLLPRRRGEVLLVLLGVADLDPLDVVPARVLGAVDRPFDTVRRVADDAGQCLCHLVVVFAQPLLIGGGVGPLLQRRDHVPHLHRTLPSLSGGDGFETVQQVAFPQDTVLLAGGAVHGDQPCVAVGTERGEERLDGGPRRHLHRRAVPALGHEPPEVAVHVNRHAHPSSARTRGMTSLWKRSMVVSIRPSSASGNTMTSAMPLRARRTTSGAITSAGPVSVTASTNSSGTSGATARSGAGSCV